MSETNCWGYSWNTISYSLHRDISLLAQVIINLVCDEMLEAQFSIVIHIAMAEQLLRRQINFKHLFSLILLASYVYDSFTIPLPNAPAFLQNSLCSEGSP